MWILTTAIALAPALGFTLKVEAGSSDPASAIKVHTVVIDKATFSDTPASVNISAGDIVEWVNLDIFDHTTTSKTGGWDVVIPAGKKARVTMKKAGAFDYFCKYHPNMTGTVLVKKPSP